MQIYKSRAGDVVDDIVWRNYGTQNSTMLRQVFSANPNLADAGDILPGGVTIVLPQIDQPARMTKGIALWD